jgi:hypothetical protein
MRLLNTPRTPKGLARGEDGFTMLIALLALLIGSLLVAAAFAAANGDIKLTKTDTNGKKAYYAAAAGIEHYKYELTSNPNYWIKCPSIATVHVPGTTDEEYSVKTLPSTGHATCETEKQATIIETAGSASGTFRIESTGTAGGQTRSIVATFTHPGFLNYVYFSNYEVEDPTNFSPQPTNCEHYYKERVTLKLTKECGPIQFAAKDKVNGPMHTNDSADLCAEGTTKPTFGRVASDKIEMNGGHYSEGSCTNALNLLGTYTESAPTLLPPETDNELLEQAGLKLSGRSVVVLNSKTTPNTLTVNGGAPVNFPANGVIFVENTSAGCGITYSPFGSDYEHDTGCGNVYVSGTYNESLTIAAANDVIINGSITTTANGEGKPTGGATLGLIATNFVRIYHPVKEGYTVKTETPATEPAINSKCVKEVKITGTLKKESATVSNVSSTAGYEKGQEITGTGIPAGTTIKEVNAGAKTLLLTKPATTPGSPVALTIYVPTALEYRAGQNLCVAKGKAPTTTYREAETLYTEACESKTTYISKGFCEYVNTSTECSEKATNLSSGEDPNKLGGALSNPTIDAAILSTHHSFIVDNYKCGAKLGELNVWGSIAQFWRGPVGTGGGAGTGYIKNYNYDERLASIQPPSFLSPTSTSWKLSRETAPPE